MDLPGAIAEHSALSRVSPGGLPDTLDQQSADERYHRTETGREINRLTHSIQHAPGTVILVSNEVGAGIVPENQLARLFRDSAGFANQKVAAAVNKVIWMVAGIPVAIKG